MSTDLYREPNDRLIVTRFYGGIDRGVCVQLTTNERSESYISLDSHQAAIVCHHLREFLAAIGEPLS